MTKEGMQATFKLNSKVNKSRGCKIDCSTVTVESARSPQNALKYPNQNNQNIKSHKIPILQKIPQNPKSSRNSPLVPHTVEGVLMQE